MASFATSAANIRPDRTTMMSLTTLLLLLLASTSSVSANYIRQSDLPHDEWVSVQRNVEYLPVLNYNNQKRRLEQEQDDEEEESSTTYYQDTFYNIQPFVDGEAEYDEYQQAWRYLGFMIDCNDGGSAAYDDDDGGTTGEGCHRYLLWAAYVDLDYEGNGIGEYQFWNPDKQAWDDTSCKYASNGNSRCAKMDCHLEDTHWSLLGLFKHRSYDDWMEQLFKHEGYCVWPREYYYFMDNARETWPQGCTESGTTLDDGEPLYYDLKPTSGGGMDIGLYLDTQCMEEYTGSITVEDILGNILMDEGSGDHSGDNNDDGFEPIETSSLAESLQMWDTIFDTWKICHPCVAYDLNNVGYNADDDASRGSSYNQYSYGDDDANNYQQEDFDCYDDADYTNVNQCMKFMAKTEMNTFTFRDISLASTQGTLVDYVPLAGYTNTSTRGAAYTFMTIFFLIFSLSILCTGIYMTYKARKYINDLPDVSEEPLCAQNPDAELT